MTNEAKLGLIAGMIGVVMMAVLYHGEPATTEAAPAQAVSNSAAVAPAVPPAALLPGASASPPLAATPTISLP